MMITKEIPDLDLGQISRSGQCFRMRLIGEDTYALIAFGRYLEVRQEGERISFSCTEEEFEKIWRGYFDLDTDYGRIKQAVDPADAYLQAAVRLGGGIRILQQELWETIITFIISQRNNIPRIKKCVDTLCRTFGEKDVDFRGEVYDLFPTPEVLAGVSEKALRDCNLGYRAPYIHKTARMVCEGAVDLEQLHTLDHGAAREQLRRLCGVGEKVADCICLFALHHMEAFPVDTHIQDMLEKYPEGFPFERYEGYAGMIQQYAFYYELFGERNLV